MLRNEDMTFPAGMCVRVYVCVCQSVCREAVPVKVGQDNLVTRFDVVLITK